MANFFKRLGEGIRIAGDLAHIGHIAWAVALIIAGAVAGFVFLPQWVVPVLAGAAGAIVTALAVWLIINRNRRAKARLTDWNPWLWYKERHAHVVVTSREEATYHTKLCLRVLQDDVSRLNWRIGWTGHGTMNVHVKNPGFGHTFRHSPSHKTQVLEIQFDRPRRKGDELTVEFTIHANGSSRVQEPFYSVTHYESRVPKSASIVVEFADALPLAEVQKEEYLDELAPWPMKPPEEVRIGKDRTLSWAIPCRPRRRYCVRWQYG